MAPSQNDKDFTLAFSVAIMALFHSRITLHISERDLTTQVFVGRRIPTYVPIFVYVKYAIQEDRT